jgi:membrane protein
MTVYENHNPSRYPMNIAKILSLLKQSFSSWSKDNVSVWAAALAYYTVFSLSPLLLVVIGVTGIIFGTHTVETNIFNQVKGLFGDAGASLLQTMVHNASKPANGIVATVTGFITLLLGASGVFGQLQQALNHIWKVEPKPDAGFIITLRNRFLSFSMVIVIAFLLLVSLILTAAISGITTFFHTILPIPGIVLESLNFVVSFGIVTILFMLLFKQLPDVKLQWKDVFVGGLLTSLLFVIGKTLIGIYLGGKGFSSTYGAAASLVVLLLWVYYIGQIVFFGAEFTKVYVQNEQGEIIPEPYAMVKEPGKEKLGKQKENVLDSAVKGYLKEKAEAKRRSRLETTSGKKSAKGEERRVRTGEIFCE